MSPSREPIVLPAIAFAAGILVCSLLQFELTDLYAGGAAILLCGGLAAWKAPRTVPLAVAAWFMVAGAGVSVLHRPGPPPELDAEEGELVLLSGCVVEPGKIEGPQTRLLLEIEPGARVRVTLTAREGETPPRVDYGRRVEIEAKVRKPRNFNNPGAFDYVHFLRRQHVYWTATARGVDKMHLLPGGCGSPWRAWSFATSQWFGGRLQKLYAADDYSARLTPALLLGDSSALERSWTEDFRRTGTYHAIVISGLHITVVAGVALFLLRVAGVPLTWTLLVAASLAWAYAAVANWQAPVVRSAAGFTFFLLSRWFFRKGRLLNLLGATALVFLACDPEQLFEPSFQLTFLSVAAIAAIASPVQERTFGPYFSGLRGLADPFRDLGQPDLVAQFRIELRLLAETVALVLHVPRRAALAGFVTLLRCGFWLAEMVTISIAVQLCLGLLLVAYFHQFSVTSVAANVFVVPLLTAAVPSALLAGLTEWEWLGAITGFLVTTAGQLASWWASWEPGWRIPDPPLWASVSAAMAIVALATLSFLRAHRGWVTVAGAASGLALFLIALYPFPPDVTAGHLELTAIDVGQGESLLVAFPQGTMMLMDGGGIPSFDPRIRAKLEIGEDVVSPYLWRRGIRRLDIIAITHLHDDHAQGIPALIRNFRPSEVWTGAVTDCPLRQAVYAAAAEVGARVVGMTRGTERPIDNARLRVFSPAPDYQPKQAPGNDDSLVVSVHYDRHHFLLTGDASSAVENRLLAGGVLDGDVVDVLKIPHHGSKSSTSETFLRTLSPLYGLISAGAGNSYGHPHPSLLGRLYANGTRVYRTDRNGLTTIRSDGRRLTVRFGDGDRSSQVFAEKYSY